MISRTIASSLLMGALFLSAEGGFVHQAALARDAAVLDAARGHAEQQAHEARKGTPAYELAQYQRAPRCNVSGPVPTTPLNGPCPPADGTTGLNNCGDDTPLEPLWTRTRTTPQDPWTTWQPVDAGGCAVDILPVMTEEDLRRLPIPPPALNVQPSRTWVLVNIETIVYTDPTPLTLRTDLLGHGVDVELTPMSWTYDFGDGHHLTTDLPGHPHPEHDVYHRYENTTTATTITLTAHWTGRYRIDGSPAWRDIPGHAETTTTSHQFSVEERTSRLVTAPCTAIPTPPDC